MLYFVPTPIGNLEDITMRSLKLLMNTSIIYCEDTRNTKKLIKLLKEKFNQNTQIQQKFFSLHSHNEKEAIQSFNVNDFLNEDVLYVSDAGMPGISDPGVFLVRFAQENKLPYEVLPGPNAALVALVGSGFSDKEFYFHGFLPHKQEARLNELKSILNFGNTAILYESTHRILKLFEQLVFLEKDRQVYAIKEISKKHEKSFLGTSEEIFELLKNKNLNGEWVVVINCKEKDFGVAISQDDILGLEISLRQKAKLLSKLTNINAKEWYNRLNNNKFSSL